MSLKVKFDVYFFRLILLRSLIIYFSIDEIIENTEKYDSEEEKIWENMEEIKPKKRKIKH
jgi:hypothetical protein